MISQVDHEHFSVSNLSVLEPKGFVIKVRLDCYIKSNSKVSNVSEYTNNK